MESAHILPKYFKKRFHPSDSFCTFCSESVSCEFLRPLNDQHDHSFAEEMWNILIVLQVKKAVLYTFKKTSTFSSCFMCLFTVKALLIFKVNVKITLRLLIIFQDIYWRNLGLDHPDSIFYKHIKINSKCLKSDNQAFDECLFSLLSIIIGLDCIICLDHIIHIIGDIEWRPIFISFYVSIC